MTFEMFSIKDYKDWNKTWTHIVPGNFGGSSYTNLLLYAQGRGEAAFFTTDGHGNITPLRSYSDWNKTWTHIVPGNFASGDFTDLLLYAQDRGEAAFIAVVERSVSSPTSPPSQPSEPTPPSKGTSGMYPITLSQTNVERATYSAKVTILLGMPSNAVVTYVKNTSGYDYSLYHSGVTALIDAGQTVHDFDGTPLPGEWTAHATAKQLFPLSVSAELGWRKP